ncbi:MAG TPA: hypothetical protein VEY09_07030 [Pyrinomonadaceae bacterium]|nr:hypothetical protein [Pyrinomonadaceae bacterium]
MNSQMPPRRPAEQQETIRIRRPSPAAPPQPDGGAQGTIVINRPSPTVNIGSSLLSQARENDAQAIAAMFKQFVPEDENIYFAEYLGVQGLWGFGTHSFACLTNRRIASIRVGVMGEVTYQDGYLEFLNSGVVYQPSKMLLYILVGGQLLAAAVMAANMLFTLPTAGWLVGIPVVTGATLLGVMLSVRGFYRFHKCGLVWIVREGVSIYVFTNRKHLSRANHLFKLCAQIRERRYLELLPAL